MSDSKTNTNKKHNSEIHKYKINKNVHQSNNKRMRLRIFFFLLFVMIIGIGITIIFYYNYYLLDVKILNVTVQVSAASSSFDTGTTRLNFARTFPGGSGLKYVDINSERNVIVKVKAIGDIAQFLTFSEEQFFISKGEYKQLSIILDIPEDASLGNYSGKVIIYFYRS